MALKIFTLEDFINLLETLLKKKIRALTNSDPYQKVSG